MRENMNEELSENVVCSILEHAADDGKVYKTKFDEGGEEILRREWL